MDDQCLSLVLVCYMSLFYTTFCFFLHQNIVVVFLLTIICTCRYVVLHGSDLCNVIHCHVLFV